MDIHTFSGKRKIGYTDLTDFTDFQGIGHDPLYKRYSGLKSLVEREIDPAYGSFFAIPDYDPDKGVINWYVDDWKDVPVRFSELPPESKGTYDRIKKETLDHYRKRLNSMSGEDLRMMGGALKYIHDDFLYCADGKIFAVAWGMAPDTNRHVSVGELVHGSPAPVITHRKPVVPPPAAPTKTAAAVPPPPPVVPAAPLPPSEPNKKPWWKSWWWLLLLIPLITLLILWLSGAFRSCSHKEINGIEELPVVVDDNGDYIDDNGHAEPIILEDGKLPADEVITAPVIDDDGTIPEIIREPGLPPVMANRLILFLEDENASIDAFAAAFKRAYPEDKYSIIGFDRYVKSLVVEVPANERETIKGNINARIPGFNFIVFDESVYELNGIGESKSTSRKGWHLDAVKAREGWSITKGSPSVKVAVIDDGIDRSHILFKNRIVSPYNVFTRNNQLSKGAGHGTMVAGLAVGAHDNISAGAAGIAPGCSLMPVQVADNGMIPLSALISGIMYAVHQGADVINVSIGPVLQGLNMLPPEDQIEISKTQFLNVARLWQRVCALASRKNAIIVFAAGNDDILSSVPPENRSENCIVVGAVDERLYPTEFTNYGYCTDISAPGEGIYSSFPVNSYSAMDGTSFSAPIVSGAVALMRSLNKNVTVKQAKDVLYRTGCDVYGFMPPMVQLPALLQSVKRGDFSRGEERGYTPVPGAAIDDDSPYESWIIPATPGVVTGPVSGIGPGTGPGEVVVPGTIPGQPPVTGTLPGGDVYPADPAAPPATAAPTDDYSLIRERIRKLKKEIRELEGQLPENRK